MHKKMYYIILFLSPGITYVIIKLASYFSTQYFPELKIGSADAWIGYSAAIVGTFITVQTVVDALERDREKERLELRQEKDKERMEIQREKKREQKRDDLEFEREQNNYIRTVMPYLNLAPDYSENRKEVILPYSEAGIYGVPFVLNNFSNNVAKDISFNEEEFYIYSENEFEIFDSEKHSEIINLYYVKMELTKTLNPNDSFKFNITLLMNPENFSNLNGIEIKKTFSISYNDILDLNQYSTYFEYILVINFDIDHNVILWLMNETSKTEIINSDKKSPLLK